MIATCTAWLLAVGGTTALGAFTNPCFPPFLAFCSRSVLTMMGPEISGYYNAYTIANKLLGHPTDALGSRAFTENAGNLGVIGVLFQRCMLATTVCYIPIALLWCFSGPILVACGQSNELAYGTQTFLRYLAPCGLGYIYFECLKKFLQCQSKSRRCSLV